MNGNKAFGYLRISKLDAGQPSLGMDVQRAKIESYCRMRGLELVRAYEEPDVSGTVPLAERPSARGMMAGLDRGEAEHVVVLRLDRLFRSAVNGLAVTEDWSSRGIVLHLIEMGGSTLCTSGWYGNLFLGILQLMAQAERCLIAERTKMALAAKKGRGEWVGGNIGYGRRRAVHGAKAVLVPDRREKAVIRYARNLRRRGDALLTIAGRLNALGVKPKRATRWRPRSVQKLLAAA